MQRLTSSAGTYASAEVANVATLQPLVAGTGCGCGRGVGGQLINSVENALILAVALIGVPLYALMISPFLLVIGLAIVTGGLAYLAQTIAGLL